MNNVNKILPGSQIKLHLTLRFTDGTEALSTRGEPPLECRLGDGTLRPGLELALYGLKVGDKQCLTLRPDQAYGPRDPVLLQDMPLCDFPNLAPPETGQVIGFTLPNGEELAGTIVSITNDHARVDFNHPLAGAELVFDVEIIDVSPPDETSESTL